MERRVRAMVRAHASTQPNTKAPRAIVHGGRAAASPSRLRVHWLGLG